MYRHVATNKYKCCSVMCYKAPSMIKKLKAALQVWLQMATN